MKNLLVTTILLSIFTVSQFATAANHDMNKSNQLSAVVAPTDAKNKKKKRNGRNPQTGKEVKSWEDAVAQAVKEASK